jgi:hypothetical protein
VGFFSGIWSMIKGTAAPSPATTAAVVARTLSDTPAISKSAHLAFHTKGTRAHTKATAPGTASICAAGPVRVCQNRSKVAAKPGRAAAIVRRSFSRSIRLRQIRTSQPIKPLTGSARMIVAIRQPWR